jgi:hypothetical protein
MENVMARMIRQDRTEKQHIKKVSEYINVMGYKILQDRYLGKIVTFMSKQYRTITVIIHPDNTVSFGLESATNKYAHAELNEVVFE